jgi:hypothetical protein
MHTTTQRVPPGARGAPRWPRTRQACPAYREPQVRELPLRLEAVAPDTFGGLVTPWRGPPERADGSSTTHPREALPWRPAASGGHA